MNRIEFIIATAIILFIAFILGWFSHWLLNRFFRVSTSEMGELDQMAQQMHEAEEQRDQAVTYYQQREQELTNQQKQTQAELEAAMGGLHDARQEVEQLRSFIENSNQN